MALATLVAGVNYNAQAIYLRPFDNGALADWSMNGGQNRNNEFLLDGAPNNANQGGNNIAYVPPADAVQEFKVADELLRRAVRPHRGRRREHVAQVGHQLLHGTGYEFYRRKWLDANSFLLNARSTPKVEHYLDQYGFEVDGPVQIPGLYNGKNKTFFMFNGEKYREGTPAAQFSTVPTAAMKNGDFSDLVDAQGKLDHHLRSGHRARRQRRVDARSVPRQHDSGRPHQPGRAEASCSTSRIRTARRPAWRRWQTEPLLQRALQQGHVLELGRQGRPQLQPERPRVLPLGQERAQRNPQHHRDPHRPGAERPAAARSARNDAFVGDWVHILGGGTVFNVRGSYTYYLEGSQSTTRFGFDATRWAGPRVSCRSSRRRRSADVPGHHLGRVRPALARLRAEHEQDLHDPAEHLADARQAQHPQRPRHALRRTSTTTNYGNAGGQIDFTRHVHPQHAEQHQRRSRATRSRRSCSARRRAATCR